MKVTHNKNIPKGVCVNKYHITEESICMHIHLPTPLSKEFDLKDKKGLSTRETKCTFNFALLL